MSVRTGWSLALSIVVAVGFVWAAGRAASPAARTDLTDREPIGPEMAFPGGTVRDVGAAAGTLDRLHLLRTGNGPRSMSLRGEELTAVLNDALPGLLPAGIDRPRVWLADGMVGVTVRIATREWSPSEQLATVLPVLPDTIEAEVEGRLVRTGRRATYQIVGARAQGIPLPGPLVRTLAQGLPGAVDRVRSGEDSSVAVLRLVLPEGIADFEVFQDRLIVRAAEPIVDRAVDGDGDA